MQAKVRYGFAEFSEDQKYRYRLSRDFEIEQGQERKAVTFIMLNPSTATEDVDDPTVRRCMAFCQAWGGTRLTVVNLFAVRATKPRALYYFDDPVGPRNDGVIERACKPMPGLGQPLVICAWGNHGNLRGRSWDVMTMLWDAGIPIHYLRRNAHTDQPTHPLYLPASSEPIPWPEQRLYAPNYKQKEKKACAP